MRLLKHRKKYSFFFLIKKKWLKGKPSRSLGIDSQHIKILEWLQTINSYRLSPSHETLWRHPWSCGRNLFRKTKPMNSSYYDKPERSGGRLQTGPVSCKSHSALPWLSLRQKLRERGPWAFRRETQIHCTVSQHGKPVSKGCDQHHPINFSLRKPTRGQKGKLQERLLIWWEQNYAWRHSPITLLELRLPRP